MYRCLREHPKAWTNAQLAKALAGQVAERTIAAITRRFVKQRIVDYHEVFPAPRFSFRPYRPGHNDRHVMLQAALAESKRAAPRGSRRTSARKRTAT